MLAHPFMFMLALTLLGAGEVSFALHHGNALVRADGGVEDAVMTSRGKLQRLSGERPLRKSTPSWRALVNTTLQEADNTEVQEHVEMQTPTMLMVQVREAGGWYDGRLVEGAKVSVDGSAEVETAKNGSCFVMLWASVGAVDVVVRRAGYVDATRAAQLPVISGKLRVALSRPLPESDWRVTLTWDFWPRDETSASEILAPGTLDVYALYVPNGSTPEQVRTWKSKQGEHTGCFAASHPPYAPYKGSSCPPGVELQWRDDHRFPGGPQSVGFRNPGGRDGKFVVQVHNYAGDGEGGIGEGGVPADEPMSHIRASQAHLIVIRGDRQVGQLSVSAAPSGALSGQWWTALSVPSESPGLLACADRDCSEAHPAQFSEGSVAHSSEEGRGPRPASANAPQ